MDQDEIKQRRVRIAGRKLGAVETSHVAAVDAVCDWLEQVLRRDKPDPRREPQRRFQEERERQHQLERQRKRDRDLGSGALGKVGLRDYCGDQFWPA